MEKPWIRVRKQERRGEEERVRGEKKRGDEDERGWGWENLRKASCTRVMVDLLLITSGILVYSKREREGKE